MSFDNYSYLLEAAATGRGIMLGWRHFIEQRIDSGALIKLTDSFIEFNNRFCGALTGKGLSKTPPPTNAWSSSPIMWGIRLRKLSRIPRSDW